MIIQMEIYASKKISTLIKDHHFSFIISIIFSLKNRRVKKKKVRRVRKSEKEDRNRKEERVRRKGKREEEEGANRRLRNHIMID